MILYCFPIAQKTVNKTVSEKFYRGVYACICIVISKIDENHCKQTLASLP